MAKIVIIGAGPTGLSAAYHLEQKGFYDYLLFEKEDDTGGLCRSVQQDGFTFDYTGHLLHINDDYFRQFIQNVVGLENLDVVNRRSWIYSHTTYTRYPYQMNLYGLPPEIIADCIEGYINRSTTLKNPKNFEQWVLKHFGKGFGDNFFFPFDSKKNAYPAQQLSTSWMGRFVPQTNLRDIIQGAVAAGSSPVGYNANFLYPKKGGIQFWVQKIAQQLKNPIKKGYCVTAIDIPHKRIHFSNGHTELFEQLISTMPLDYLLKNSNGIQPSLKNATKKLLCNSVVNFNLGIKRENLSDKHWIYMPEKQYPFYRLGFWHNFSPSMAPQGCSSLYGEFSHIKASAQKIETLLQTSLSQTKQLLGISNHEIMTQKVLNIPHAYVIYDQWREKNLPTIIERLKDLTIHSVGRYGEWKYSSMQEAILDGKKIADRVIVLPARTYSLHTVVPSENSNEKDRNKQPSTFKHTG
ncbi:MAG: FAD-dependent oxidoreductase [Candidatus Babeliales bacterium]